MLKILVIDDEPLILELMKIFESEIANLYSNIEFHYFQSEEDVYTYTKNNPYLSLIITDLKLNNDINNGINIIRHIRNELKNALVKIIVLTGRDTVKVNHLLEPLDINAIINKLDMFTEQINLHDLVFKQIKQHQLDLERDKNENQKYLQFLNTFPKIKDILNKDFKILPQNCLSKELKIYISKAIKQISFE